MKYLLVVFIILILAGYAKGEVLMDKIYLHSGQIFECIVTSVDTSTVTIKIPETDIRRVFYKYEIQVIIYANGTVETFPVTKPKFPDETEKRLNKMEIKSAEKEGITKGVTFCCVILLLLMLIGGASGG